jgi:GTP diphosphokinase / guanosine-3',5'-bis(diphosphate) 3'-diphosphatase
VGLRVYTRETTGKHRIVTSYIKNAWTLVIWHQQGEPISDIALILKAAEFAADKHRNERRKGRSRRPYIGHCIEVASMVADIGRSDDANVIIAALLHDTVEDTGTTFDEIREGFGETVAKLVAEMTDDKSLKKKDRKEKQVEHAPTLSDGAKLIKVADKISNVREITYDPPRKWSVARKSKYYDWAERVVNATGRIDPEMRLVFDQTLNQARALLKENGE